MTYFLLSLTNKCNKSCAYCVVKPWLNNPEYPDKAKAEDFLTFLGKEMREGDVVELTGGEPTLLPKLWDMLDWLQERGAKTILRTNGIGLRILRKSYKNLIVVLARHNSEEDYWQSRKDCLLPHDLAIDGIPEHLIQREDCKPVFVNNETSPLKSHPFTKAYFITSDGKVRFMPCVSKDMGTIWDFKPQNWHCCATCSYMLGAWNLANRIDRRKDNG